MKRILILLSALLLAGPLFAQSGDGQQTSELNSADNTTQEQVMKFILQLQSLTSGNIDSSELEELTKEFTELKGDVKEIGGDSFYGYLLATMSVLHTQLGNFDEAIELGTEAREILKESLNENNIGIYSQLLLFLTYECNRLENFNKSIEFGTEALEIQKNTLNEKNIEIYVQLLFWLADDNDNIGNYGKAIDLCTEAMELQKEAYGDRDSLYVELLSNISNYYDGIGNYGKAIEHGTNAAEIIREVRGDRHPDYAKSLQNLSVFYWHLADYGKAIELCTKAMEIEREVLGERHPDYAMSLGNLALYYDDLGDYDKAIEFGTEVIEIRREVLGERHPDYAASLNNLASIYSNLGNYNKTIELDTKAMEIRREVLGERHPDYAASLSNMALDYARLGYYKKSIELETVAMEIRKDVLGDRHPDYAASLNNFTIYFNDLGNYEKSIAFGTEAVEIRKEVLGDCHPDYARSLINLAIAYNGSNEYEKAIEYGTKAVEIMKEVFGDRHPDFALSLINLADFYSDLGNYYKAIELETEAMEIQKEVLGERHPDFATSLGGLASNYTDIGDYEKAIELGTEAMQIRKEVLGEYHPDYACSLFDLARVYSKLGNYNKAIDLEIETLEIRHKVFGNKHPSYALTLNNLAASYNNLKNYGKAIEIETEAMEIQRDVLGDRHSDYARSLNNLAVLYHNTGDLKKSLDEKQLAKKVYTENLKNNFSFLTANERNLYWGSIGDLIENGTQYCVSCPSDDSNVLAYDVTLLCKGILLSSELEFDKVIKESGDEELLAKFEQLRLDRLQLEVWYKKSVDERPADEVRQLEKEAEQLEKDLIAGSKEYGDFTRSLAIEWADVRDALREGDVAIEFAKVVTGSRDYYVALMLRMGWDAPKCVNLGTADDFAPYLAMGSNDLYRSQELSEKIWAGIAETADLKEGDRVLFSPDGIFYQMAIEYLPADGDGETAGRTMSEKYQMRRLSSTRELCLEPGSVAEDSAVLYGGLRYERKPKTAETQNKSAAADGDVAKSEEKSGQKRDLVIGTLLAQRGADDDTLNRGTIAYLPGTLAEVDTLTVMLQQKNIKHDEYKEYAGKEEKFKAMSGHAPKLIHIATHGFYLSPTEAEELSQQRQRDFLMTGDDSHNRVVDYSMSRTGLLLSESLPAWFGRPVPEDEDDGILTAKEIAGLDLRGVDLAVLSACSTGLGDITGDGVAGLQRGFKKAGVKTLILSLWKVDDDATRQLMTKFYANYTSGKSKRESFDSAIASLRSDPKYSDPQYWAAFIMLD